MLDCCPMQIVVQKYGGSSVADPAKIRRVAERVVATRQAGKQVVVVVSAMGKTTDQLLALAKQVAPAPPRRELDMLLTCGERISMALLSMAINELGYEAISFTGSQSGILTNDRHSGARIIEVRPIRVQDELERGRVVIVAGFQGVSYKREITTLGRGGSDTTAVALAAALGAEYCEICSDVEGVFSADPRLVDAAELREAVSHDEMEELAAHGAKVLHPAAVEFARAAQIALYARATAGAGGGTRIDPVGAAERLGQVVGVTGQKGLVRLALQGPGAAAALVAALREEGAQVVHLRADADRAVAHLALDDLPDWTAARTRLCAALGAGLALADRRGAVSVVGSGLGGDPAAVARALELAGPVDELATSPLRITAFCAEDRVDTMVRALHAMVERAR
jgi:aspartate kinase